ncbi:MAG: insulinase family protein [Gammaproteobacteria bacterium]|nr:MAG: insulinase family protein [Gammaproteobacteria bacterium]
MMQTNKKFRLITYPQLLSSRLFFCVLFISSYFIVGHVHAAPKIEQWNTANGVKTLFVAAPELAMLDVAITFDAGSGRDAQLAGLSRLTHSLLNTGTGALDADAIAEQFEDVGAQYGSSVNLDRSSVALRSLTDKVLLEPALKTFIDVLTKPSFPEKDFLRLKNQALIAIKDSQQRPADIASRAFYKAIYGQHPYANPALGFKGSIESISLEDVKNFHQQYLVADNALITIVGGIDDEQAKKIAEQISANLAQGAKPESLAQPKSLNEVADVYVPYPSQQAHVYLGQLGIQRGHPDYFTLYAGNHILGGGGFTSRLVKEVRVERGLSYSVYSYYFPMYQPGPFTLGLQTRSDQAQQAAEVSLQTIEKFVSEGPTEDELASAKNNIIGGFPLRIDSNRDILGYLSLIGYYELPLDYLETFTNKISAVTEDEIISAFSKHLQPNKLVKIIVGGPVGGSQASGEKQ